MAGVHGGEQIETLGATNFAQDDAVRPHTQGVLHKVADGDGALAFQVRGAGFQRQPVRLLQAEFRRVLDGQHALARIDHLGERIEHRRLARAGTARDDDVEPARARDLERCRHLVRHGAALGHHVERDRLGGEFTDRDGRAAQRERRHDDVDARAVRQAGVGQRGRLVDAAADLIDDALGDLEQMLLVAEMDLGKLQLALLFDVGLVRTVDHDVADIRVAQQLLQRAEAEKLVDQHLLQRELLAPVERQFQLGQNFNDDRPEFFGELVRDQMERVAERVVRSDVFEECGHSLALEAPDRLASALLDFIRENG